MRVTLQRVLCHDEGDEETVTEVITLNKNTQRIEHLVVYTIAADNSLSTKRFFGNLRYSRLCSYIIDL